MLHSIISIPLNRDKKIGDLVKNHYGHYNIIEEEADINLTPKFIPHCIVLLSNDDINTGDAYLFKIREDDYEIMICQDDAEADRCNTHSMIKNGCCKIIATYPKLDQTHKISELFLKEWVENPVEKVDVKYNSRKGYKKSGMKDVTGVEIIEGHIINADGYCSSLDEKYLHIVEYENGQFGSDVYTDFEPLSRYDSIEIIGHIDNYKEQIIRENEADNFAWSGNIGLAYCDGGSGDEILELQLNLQDEIICSIPERGVVITAIQGGTDLEIAAMNFLMNNNNEILDKYIESELFQSVVAQHVEFALSDSVKNYWYKKFKEDGK